MAGLDNKDGRHVCLDCGRSLVPLGFEGEEELQQFASRAEEAERDFLKIPLVPVDTWSLFNVPLLDLPLVQVAKVVELSWEGRWEVPSDGVPFQDYWRAVGSPRYGAEEVLLMDLAGMQHSRPNFEALKALMKRKYCVWLEMGVREVPDIFDAFTLGSERVMVGSMTCGSQELLEEIIELSDCSVPLLYHDGKVRWRSKSFGPPDLRASLRLLHDLGFQRAAVLDLRRLGRGGFDRELAEMAIASELELVYGGGVREPDLSLLRDMGAVGGILDPFTPVLRDLLERVEREEPEEGPVPSPVGRESPRGYGLDA